jgi:ABC-2 type transport system permease protein
VIALLRGDWRKLRHRWMPRILMLILIALVALVFLGISSRARFRGDLVLPDGLVVALSLAAGFAAFIWPVLAGSWSGGEYSWGTVRSALTRRPSRIAFSLSGLFMVLLTIGAGLCLVLLAGAIAGAIVGAANSGVAAVTAPGTSAGQVILKLFFAVWYTSAFYAVIAYAAGVIFRSAPAGIGVGIGFSVAQSAVSAIFENLGDPWKSIALHFPNAYTTALTSRIANEIVSSGPFGRISATAASIPVSILGLAIYLAILIGCMLVIVRQRDVTT